MMINKHMYMMPISMLHARLNKSRVQHIGRPNLSDVAKSYTCEKVMI